MKISKHNAGIPTRTTVTKKRVRRSLNNDNNSNHNKNNKTAMTQQKRTLFTISPSAFSTCPLTTSTCINPITPMLLSIIHSPSHLLSKLPKSVPSIPNNRSPHFHQIRFNAHKSSGTTYSSYLPPKNKKEELLKKLKKPEQISYKSNVNIAQAAQQVIANPLKNKENLPPDPLSAPLKTIRTSKDNILNPYGKQNFDPSGSAPIMMTTAAQRIKTVVDDSESYNYDGSDRIGVGSSHAHYDDGSDNGLDFDVDFEVTDKMVHSYKVHEVILAEVESLEADITSGIHIPMKRIEHMLDMAVEHDNPYAILEIFRLLDPDQHIAEGGTKVKKISHDQRQQQLLSKQQQHQQQQHQQQQQQQKGEKHPLLPPLNLNIYTHTLYACALTGNAQLAYHIYMMMALDTSSLQDPYSDDTIARLLTLTLSPDLIDLSEVNNNLFNPYTDLCYDLANYLGANPQKVHQHFQQHEDDSNMGLFGFVNSPESKLYAHRLPQQFVENPYRNITTTGLHFTEQHKKHLIQPEEDEHFNIEAPAITSLATTFALTACIRAARQCKPTYGNYKNKAQLKFQAFEKEHPSKIDATIRSIMAKVLFHDTVRITPSHIALATLGMYTLPYQYLDKVETLFTVCFWRQLPVVPSLLFNMMHVARESSQRLHLLMYFDTHFIPTTTQPTNEHQTTEITFQHLISSFRAILDVREQIFQQSKQWRHIRNHAQAQEWFDQLEENTQMLYDSDGGPYGLTSRFGYLILPHFLSTIAMATGGSSSNHKVKLFEVWAKMLQQDQEDNSGNNNGLLPVFEQNDDDDVDNDACEHDVVTTQSTTATVLRGIGANLATKKKNSHSSIQTMNNRVMKPLFYAFILALSTMRGLPYVNWSRSRDCCPTLWRESLLLSQLITHSTTQYDRYVFSAAIEASINAGRIESVLFLANKLLNMRQRVRIRLLDSILHAIQFTPLTITDQPLGLTHFNLQPQQKELSTTKTVPNKPLSALPSGFSIIERLIQQAMGEPVEYLLHVKRVKFGLDTTYYKSASFATNRTHLSEIEYNVMEYESEDDDTDDFNQDSSSAVNDVDPRYAKILQKALHKTQNRLLSPDAVGDFIRCLLFNGHNHYALAIIGHILGLTTPLSQFPSKASYPEELHYLLNEHDNTSKLTKAMPYKPLHHLYKLQKQQKQNVEPTLLPPAIFSSLTTPLQNTPQMECFLEEVRNAFLLTQDHQLEFPPDETTITAQNYINSIAYHPHLGKIPTKMMSSLVSQVLIAGALNRSINGELIDHHSSNNGNNTIDTLPQQLLAILQKTYDTQHSNCPTKKNQNLATALTYLTIWAATQIGPKPIPLTFVGHIAALVEVANISNNSRLLEHLVQHTKSNPTKHIDFTALLQNSTNDSHNHNDNNDEDHDNDNNGVVINPTSSITTTTPPRRGRQRQKKNDTLVFTHDFAKLEKKIASRTRYRPHVNITPELTIGGGEIVDRNNRVQLHHVNHLVIEGIISAANQLIRPIRDNNPDDLSEYGDRGHISVAEYKSILFPQHGANSYGGYGEVLMKLYNISKHRFNWVDLTTSHHHLNATFNTLSTTDKSIKNNATQHDPNTSALQLITNVTTLSEYLALLPMNPSPFESHGYLESDEHSFYQFAPSHPHNLIKIDADVLALSKTQKGLHRKTNPAISSVLERIKNNNYILDLRQKTTTYSSLATIHAIQQLYQISLANNNQAISTFVIVARESHPSHAFPRTPLLSGAFTAEYVQSENFFEQIIPSGLFPVGFKISSQKVYGDDDHKLDLYDLTLKWD